ncbi:hypothetical protein BaRGS_00040130 [Batillaria attramentaria]|uniref:Uncharacterized protein n=1 Tax=Batillaria attramentaria TaxID=370345 RepID=A0ABD0J1D0_9CAEN
MSLQRRLCHSGVQLQTRMMAIPKTVFGHTTRRGGVIRLYRTEYSGCKVKSGPTPKRATSGPNPLPESGQKQVSDRQHIIKTKKKLEPLLGTTEQTYTFRQFM